MKLFSFRSSIHKFANGKLCLTQRLRPTFFAGRCDEALDFYRQSLGAEIEMLAMVCENIKPSRQVRLQENRLRAIQLPIP